MYTLFQVEVANEDPSFLPFVQSLPPVGEIQNFTYDPQTGTFCLTFNDEKPVCRGEHTGLLAEKVKNVAFKFEQTFSGSFKRAEKTLTLDNFSVEYQLKVSIFSVGVSAKILQLTSTAGWGLKVEVVKGPFTFSEDVDYETTSQFRLIWGKEAPN